MVPCVFVFGLTAQISAGFECEACSREVELLISDISDYLDEFTPDIETLEELLETEDIGPMLHQPSRGSGKVPWYAALVPTIGIKIYTLPMRTQGDKVQWELFLAWKGSWR